MEDSENYVGQKRHGRENIDGLSGRILHANSRILNDLAKSLVFPSIVAVGLLLYHGNDELRENDAIDAHQAVQIEDIKTSINDLKIVIERNAEGQHRDDLHVEHQAVCVCLPRDTRSNRNAIRCVAKKSECDEDSAGICENSNPGYACGILRLREVLSQR